MTKQIFLILLIVAGVIVAAIWYANHAKNRAMNSGEVSGRGPAGESAKAAAPESAPPNQPAQTQGAGPEAQGGASTPADEAVVTPPATDSIHRNPPNGKVFAGRGKYQLYRQGDITWRLNTETGQACILFATNAEWRNPRVFEHGCGGS